MNERPRAMRELWTKEKAEFHGEFVNFDPGVPVAQARPAAASADLCRWWWRCPTFRRIADLGDAWLASSGSPEELGPQIKRMREVAGREVPVTGTRCRRTPRRRGDSARGSGAMPTLPEAETRTGRREAVPVSRRGPRCRS
ncbi:LLM class F420-dependent oxidoreductase OS=Streptomyces antimycoticus OX=68175 GN=SANT12839_086290 PE=4 SV=1 [Streptomyces antimycoticus]